MVVGILVLLICQLLGELVVFSLDIPVPGAVVGMVILLAGLMIKGRVPESLRGSAQGILSILPLLLVPAGVGLMVHYELIMAEWIGILAALAVSTLVTLVWVVGLLKLTARKERKE